jgi:hypothetical protein
MRAVVGAPGGNKAGEAEAERASANDAGRSPAVQAPQTDRMAQPDRAAQTERKPQTEQEPQSEQAPQTEQTAEPKPPSPGFGERGRMRRRARFLRKARELAYRDLGGLVFDLHRFGQRNDPLVLAKLATLREIDTELRGLESGLHDHRPVTVLREVGIAACPRCAAIHGSGDRFCPGCGLAFDAKADRPISTAPVAPQGHAVPTPAQPPLAAPQNAAATPAPAPKPTAPQNAAAVPAPAPKPTAPPVAAKPAAPPVATKPAAPKAPEQAASEDEPTQILRPPRGDAGA